MKITKTIKRNGTITDWDLNKISKAIFEAAKSVGGSDIKEAEKLANKVEELLIEDKLTTPTIEEVQDYVEKVLIENKHAKTSKAYILYRKERTSIRQEKKNVQIDVANTISEYLQHLDWRVNENSNQGYSLGGMILNSSGKLTANYWLSNIYPAEVGEAHRDGSYHIHDLSMFSGYCAGWSLRVLLEEGFNGVPNQVESAAPAHLSSAVSQMVNFLWTLQNEWAGAQAFSSFDTYLAPFVKKYATEIKVELTESEVSFPSAEKEKEYLDKKVYKYVKQCLQSFVFNMNIPSRWGTQTPFTNITLDWTVPEDLKDKKLLLGGKPFEHTFSELQSEMDLINEILIKIMMAGDERNRVFTFPIPTYNITKDFNWDWPNTNLLFEMSAKYGMPYFQNFLNSELKPTDVRSMCCRLQLDLKELLKRGNGLFGSAEMTGSIGVVTINAARIGYQYADDHQGFLKRIKELMELAKVSLELKRKEVSKWLERGLYPYTKRYLGHFNNHFSTIGVNGMNEAILNFTKGQEDITTKFGQEFAQDVLLFMREQLTTFQEETGNMYNLEASPTEGATHRFAREDQKRFPEIIQAGTYEAPYYTNSTQIPVEQTDDIFEALDLQDDLQTKYTGGTVFHTYLGERISNPEACKALIKTVFTKYRLPYLTVSPTFSICPIHGYLTGEHDFCPTCDQENGINTSDTRDYDKREKFVSQKAKENK